MKTLVEAGYNYDKFFVDNQTPNYYHPGKSGRLFLNKEKFSAYFDNNKKDCFCFLLKGRSLPFTEINLLFKFIRKGIYQI